MTDVPFGTETYEIPICPSVIDVSTEWVFPNSVVVLGPVLEFRRDLSCGIVRNLNLQYFWLNKGECKQYMVSSTSNRAIASLSFYKDFGL